MYKITKRKPLNLNLADRYKNYCNTGNSLLRQTKRRNYEKEFNKFKYNPKKQWQLLSKFLTNAPRNISISNVINDVSTYKQALQIANAFSDYFSTLPTIDQPAINLNMRRSAENLFLFPVTPDEDCSTLLTLKITSAGLDNVCASHLKLAAHCISIPLSNIINKISAHTVFS